MGLPENGAGPGSGGGKYPDAWHYVHMANPQGMFEKSNMPPYAWLALRGLDTSSSVKKASILGYGYGSDEIGRQIDGFRNDDSELQPPGKGR